MGAAVIDRVPLSEAGLRLGVSYWRARDLLLTGRLKGGKNGGRFWVDVSDLDRLALEFGRAPAPER